MGKPSLFLTFGIILIAVVAGISLAIFGVSPETVRYGVFAAGGVALVIMLWRYVTRGPEPVAEDGPATGAGTDTEVLQRLLAQTQQAVGFEPVFPPEHPMRRETFFGGLPFAPRDLEWPRYEQTGAQRAAIFMGQVAVRDLPDVLERASMREDAVLYFFLPNYVDLADMSGFVVAAHGDRNEWVEHDAPEDMAEIDWLTFTEKWNGRSGRSMTSFPKWEMTPKAVETLPDDYAVSAAAADGDQSNRLNGMIKAVQQVAWSAVYTRRAAASFRLPLDAPMESLEPRVPRVWLSVEAVTAFVLSELDMRSDVLKRGLERAQQALAMAAEKAARGDDPSGQAAEMAQRSMDRARARDAEMGPLIGPLREKVQVWFDRACAEGRFASVPEAEWAGFLNLIEDIRAYHPDINEFPGRQIFSRVSEIALQVSDILATHDAQTFDRLTEVQVQAIAHRHCGRRKWGAEHRAYDLEQQQMFGSPVDIQGSGAQDEVLLMQFVYEEGMDWRLGDVGAAQYWISKADLAAGRYDRAELTLETH